MTKRQFRDLFVGCVVAVTMSGCVTIGLEKHDAGVFRDVSGTDGRLITNDSTYVGGLTKRISFRDSKEFSEYALFRSQTGQAEIVFIEVPERSQNDHALEFAKLIVDTTRMYAFNQGRVLEFQQSVSVESQMAQTWMQLYRQTDTDRACVGFYSAWDMNTLDPDFKPVRILFGYHCNVSGQPLNAARAEEFIKSIDIRGITVPLNVETAYDLNKPAPEREQQIANLVTAQEGTAGAPSGIPAFPLLVSRRFPVGDGCPRNDC